MTEAQAPRQHALPQVLSGIISAARRRAGVAALSDAALADEIRDWQRILAQIPPDRIEECELHAIRNRVVKALLQPQELIASWHVIREADRANKPEPMAVAGGESCWYCEGTGWQTLARKVPDSYGENTFVRPCACSAAPLEIRKLEPLGEPEWRKRKHSVIWERTE